MIAVSCSASESVCLNGKEHSFLEYVDRAKTLLRNCFNLECSTVGDQLVYREG